MLIAGALAILMLAGGACVCGGMGLLMAGAPSDDVTSETANAVLKFDGTTGASQGAFVTAGLGGLATPVGMAFASDGLLYVGSSGNNRILRYNASTGAFVDQFAGAPGQPISGPTFLTVVPAPDWKKFPPM